MRTVNNFWSRHRSAVDAGLNAEWALKVAYGCIELDAALGEMDHQSESVGSIRAGVSVDVYVCTCTIDAACQNCIDDVPF